MVRECGADVGRLHGVQGFVRTSERRPDVLSRPKRWHSDMQICGGRLYGWDVLMTSSYVRDRPREYA
jgi:hypothetical protein